MNKKQLTKELKSLKDSCTVILSSEENSHENGPFIMIYKTLNDKYIVGLCMYDYNLDEFILSTNSANFGENSYIFSFDNITKLVSFLPFYFTACIFDYATIPLLNDESLKMCDYSELETLYKNNKIRKLNSLLHKYWDNNTLHLDMQVFMD